MTYRIAVHGRAACFLSTGLPEKVAAACLEFLAAPLADRPRHVGKPLLEPRLGQWSARRGEYRVIYTVDDAARVVHVVDVAHRRDAYRS